ncbi:molybdopterin-guanine dinucleotide biosynthesis protein B [Calditrichota bacterium GD2]
MKFKGLNVLQIVGPKNAGKTMHAEWLISRLKERGLRVGALKHSSHSHPIDRPGSDSFRLQKVGASPTVFYSANSMGVFYPSIDEKKADQLLAAAFKEVDLVIVESFNTANGPKIVLDEDGRQWKHFTQVIAVISETALPTDLPLFKKFDERLIDFVIEHFHLTR